MVFPPPDTRPELFSALSAFVSPEAERLPFLSNLLAIRPYSHLTQGAPESCHPWMPYLIKSDTLSQNFNPPPEKLKRTLPGIQFLPIEEC